MKTRLTVRNASYIALLAGALSACSDSAEPGPTNPNTNTGGGGVTLRIATYLASPDEQAALQAVIDAHHARHPNVRVELKPLLLSPPQTIAQLTGQAPIEGGWDLAIHTFTSVPGVKDVDNRLRIQRNGESSSQHGAGSSLAGSGPSAHGRSGIGTSSTGTSGTGDSSSTSGRSSQESGTSSGSKRS